MYLTAEGKKGIEFKNLPVEKVSSVEDEGGCFVLFILCKGQQPRIIESWQLKWWKLTSTREEINNKDGG